jgi:hypothetical protein
MADHPAMKNTKLDRTQALLERGFPADYSHLQESGKIIAENLCRTTDLAAGRDGPDAASQIPTSPGEQAHRAVFLLNSRVEKLKSSLHSHDPAALTQALRDWQAVQAEEEQLSASLDALRQTGYPLDERGRRLWKSLEIALKAHRLSCEACLQTIRIKRDLLLDPTADQMEHLFQQTLANLPDSLREERLEAEAYEQEYENAAAELQHEKERAPGGLVETVKPLFMWIETIEERAEKNLTARRRAV